MLSKLLLRKVIFIEINIIRYIRTYLVFDKIWKYRYTILLTYSKIYRYLSSLVNNEIGFKEDTLLYLINIEVV